MLFHLYKIPTFALTILALTVYQFECQSQNNTYLHAQYIKDIEHLNQKLVNYQRRESAQIGVSTLSELERPIDRVVYFQSETVWLGTNQQAEFSFANLHESVIDVQIRQTLLTQKDFNTYPTAQVHFRQNQSHFAPLSQPPSFRPCKLNDPQLQLSRLRTVPFISFQQQQSSQQRSQQSSQQSMPLLTDHGQYRILRHTGNNNFSLYKVQIDTSRDNLSKTQIIQVDSARVKGISQGEKVFLFEYDKVGMIFSAGRLWRMNVKEDKLLVEEFAVVEELIQMQKQTQYTQPQKQKQKQTKYQQPVQILPLKHGLLIQFQNHFQIYLQSLPSTNSAQPLPTNSTQSLPRKLSPKLSAPHVQTLTSSTSIAQIVVSQQLSHQSGYKIFILLKHNYLIELQYGAYSSINVYQIPFGEWLQSLAVVDDVVEVTFAITKSKRVHFYLLELNIDRSHNPRTPKLYLNRFYNDLKDFKKAQFFNEQQLLLIGQRDVLVYDWPVDSRVLIHQNITQTPYHFSIENLQSIFHLQRYSTPASTCVLLITEQDMTIALLKRQPQSISCSSDKSFDSIIEIVKFCDSNKAEICKYVSSMRGIVQNPDGERINTIKRYLIAGLIAAIVVAVLVVGRQICRNRKTIEKLQKIKQSLDKKLSQMETKGKKITQNDKFEQLQEELPHSTQLDTKVSQLSAK